MNKLNEMDIAKLEQNEIERLEQYEKDFNKLHSGEELYLLVLKK